MMTAISGEATPPTAIAKTANPAQGAAAGWAVARPVLWQFGRILAMASSLAFVLWCLVPHLVPYYRLHFILDNSWIQTLHVAFEQRWRFGRDILFTYGPWGFLCGGFYPPTYFTSVIAWSMLSISFWLACWRVATYSFRHRWNAWLWMMGFVGVTGLPTGQSVLIDVPQIAWVLILLSLHFFVDDSPFSIPKILITVSLGWLGLIKFTGMVMAAAVVLAIGSDEIWRHRRFPWIIIIFVASMLCFWLLAGQQLGLLWPYLSSSWQVSTGYTEAMIFRDGNEFTLVTIFLAVTVTVSSPLIFAAIAKHRFFGIPPLMSLGVITLVVFKHGFVRCDHFHEVVSTLSVMLIGLISLAVSWPILRAHGSRAVLMEVLLLDVALLYTTLSYNACVPGKGMLAQFAGLFYPPRHLSAQAFLSGSDDLRAAYQHYLAKIREEYPLPQLTGDVDVYPWQEDVLFAYGLNYRPRPVIQSYSAYTPELAEINAAFLRDGQSAENILFRVETLNERYPSLDDGRSWPELLTRYDVTQMTEKFVLLKRSAISRSYHLVPVGEVPIRFGERLGLPDATEAPFWAEIKIDKTLCGTLACAFYRPPDLYLIVYLRNGRHLTYSLIPEMARDGFLLSPLINDNAAFVVLALAGEENNLKDREVASMKIVAGTASGSTACYKSPMRLCLYRLDFTRQNPAGLESKQELPEPASVKRIALNAPDFRESKIQ